MQTTNHISTKTTRTHATTYNAPRHDSYMHAIPSPTTFRPSPHDVNQHIIITSTGYKYPTTINAWTYDTLCTCSTKTLNIINIHAFTNNINIIINQQLYTISHNSSKGENPPYYYKHHIQHLSIIHTSSYWSGRNSHKKGGFELWPF